MMEPRRQSRRNVRGHREHRILFRWRQRRQWRVRHMLTAVVVGRCSLNRHKPTGAVRGECDASRTHSRLRGGLLSESVSMCQISGPARSDRKRLVLTRLQPIPPRRSGEFSTHAGSNCAHAACVNSRRTNTTIGLAILTRHSKLSNCGQRSRPSRLSDDHASYSAREQSQNFWEWSNQPSSPE